MFNIILGTHSFSLDEKTPILSLIEDDKKKMYYAAKVNNRLRELTYKLCFDCNVELLTIDNYDASKVYETSLRYLIAMAMHNIHPEYIIRISYHISRSMLISIITPDHVQMSSKLAEDLTNEMKRLVDLDIPFERISMSKEDAHSYYVEHGETDKDMILKYRPEKIVHFYKCGDYLNYMYGYMVPSTGYLKSFNLFVYGKELIIQYPRHEFNGAIPPFDDAPTFSKVLKRAHKWAKICNAEILGKMNEHIVEDTYVDFINMNETLHNDMLHDLGNKIVENMESTRLICIAGPSSSGKTTFSNRLRIELMSRGFHPLKISLDMYYKEKKDCPVDENGKPDFEDINALDIELFNENILGLLNGDEVTLPIYNFQTGRLKEGIKAKIGPDTPIIIEGIHALNDKLTHSIPKDQKFKIYIAPQFQINIDNCNPISYTDIRLLRRIVRDKQFRGTSAEGTLAMWQSVRAGEFKWIYPHQENCDYVYNSGLTYELCVLKKYALPALQEVKEDSPYYIAANRLLKFLKYFKDMDDKLVPCNSLLREFIGGSCFKDV